MFGSWLNSVNLSSSENKNNCYLTSEFVKSLSKGIVCNSLQNLINDNRMSTRTVFFLQESLIPDTFMFCFYTIDKHKLEAIETSKYFLHISSCAPLSLLLEDILNKHKMRMEKCSADHLTQTETWPDEIIAAREEEAGLLHQEVQYAFNVMDDKLLQNLKINKEKRRIKRSGRKPKK